MPGRPLLQYIGKIGIGIDYRRAAVFRQSAKNLGLGFGNPFKAVKKFNMHRINVSHDRNVRLRKRHQPCNLALCAHTHFNYGIGGVHIQLAKGFRHSDKIVVIASGSISRRKLRQGKLQFFLGRGFAGAPGQRNDLSLKLPPHITPDFAVGNQRIRHHNLPHRRHVRQLLLHHNHFHTA